MNSITLIVSASLTTSAICLFSCNREEISTSKVSKESNITADNSSIDRDLIENGIYPFLRERGSIIDDSLYTMTAFVESRTLQQWKGFSFNIQPIELTEADNLNGTISTYSVMINARSTRDRVFSIKWREWSPWKPANEGRVGYPTPFGALIFIKNKNGWFVNFNYSSWDSLVWPPPEGWNDKLETSENKNSESNDPSNAQIKIPSKIGSDGLDFNSNYKRWDKEIINISQNMKVSGKALTFSKFGEDLLAEIYGKNEFRFTSKKGEETITGCEWLMDCLFRPKLARSMLCIRVPGAVASVLALPSDNPGSDCLLSYNQITSDCAPNRLAGNFRNQILIISQQLEKVPAGDKSAKILAAEFSQLTTNLHNFESIIRYLDFASLNIPLGDTGKSTHVTNILTTLPQLHETLDQNSEKGISDARLTNLIDLCRAAAGLSGEDFAPIPMNVDGTTEWNTIGEIMIKLIDRKQGDQDLLKVVLLYEELANADPNSKLFVEKLKAVVEVSEGS